MNFVINYFSSFFIVIGLMLIFGFINSFLEKQALTYTYFNFGKLGIFLSSFLGTIIHESSHAIFVILFGNNIHKIKLFSKINEIENGKPLGYVKFSYKKNFIGKISLFFIGIAPIIGGPLIILVFLKILLPSIYNDIYNLILLNIEEGLNIFIILKDVIFSFLKGFFSSNLLIDLRFYLFIFIATSIACHVTLSLADIKGALNGFLFLLILVTIICICGLVLQINEIILKVMIIITTFFSLLWIISFFFSLLSFLIQYFIFSIIKKI